MANTDVGAGTVPAPQDALPPSINQNATATAPVVPETEIHKFFNETDFRLDWSNRRKVVKMSLIVLGALYSVAHLVVVFCFVYQIVKGLTLDPNIVYLLTTLTYTDSGLAASIIMAYVFGANADVKDLRGRMSDMVSNVFSAKRGS